MTAPRMRLDKGCLAAALALGTAAAVPTVVAFSEDPLVLPSAARAAAGSSDGARSGGGGAAAGSSDVAGSSGGAAAAHATARLWSLSRVVEQVLGKFQQGEVVETEGEDAMEGLHEEHWLAEEQAPAAAAAAADPTAAKAAAGQASAALLPAGISAVLAAAHEQAGAMDAATVLLQVEQGQSGRQRMKSQRAHGASASELAAEHADEMRQMQHLAAAELACLQASSAAASSATATQQQHIQQHGRPQLDGGWWGSAAAAVEEKAGHPAARPALAAAASRQAAGEEQRGRSSNLPRLPPRFTDAELMRFAMMHGLLKASSPRGKQAALRDGAAAAARTAVWLQEHPFSTDEELQRFAHLVSWQGADAEGRPILRIAIGRAVTECCGSAALVFANATITLVERGVQERLRDGTASTDITPACSGAGSGMELAGGCDPSSSSGQVNAGSAAKTTTTTSNSGSGSGSSREGDARPEQIIVVMDCSGASTLNAARISWVFQAVAATLNRHYPGRLHELVLLELPVVLGWMVKGVKQLVHPDTRHKFRVVSQGKQQHVAAALGPGGGGSSSSPLEQHEAPAQSLAPRLATKQQQAEMQQQESCAAAHGAT